MPEPSLFSPAAVAIDVVIDNILHEVRRALVQPIYQVHRGDVALAQSVGLSFGWLARAEDARLVPTPAGRQALASQQSGFCE